MPSRLVLRASVVGDKLEMEVMKVGIGGTE